ncbi:hypothetical protein MYX64_08150 [Nitrospinae bacterium AH_259_B05_G02_I21]|nr:hypothetical protein [Nitrospinae bacterium AH_259_B05_G02_I21]
MKARWTVTVVVLVAGVVLSGCSRRQSAPYHGVATEMNFGRQVINPKAPDNPELPAEVSGPIGQSIYKRQADTYDKPVPDCLFAESCTFGSGPSETETGDSQTEP